MTKQLHIEGLFSSTDELWENVQAAFRLLPNRRSQAEWLQGSHALNLQGSELTVEVPHKFTKDLIEKRCRQSIEEIVNRLLGKHLAVRFVVAEGSEAPAAEAAPAPAPRRAPSRENAPRPAAAPLGQPLNRRYHFDTFVVGESSRFACAVAMAVANCPGDTYNPLFLCGGVGTGKTHLLQAIGQEVARSHPSLRLAYITAEAFTYEFVSAIRERRTDAFRKRYRGVDVWIVDDVQFIAGKEGTEEEFFLTLTSLQETGRQVVLGSDRYPKDMHLMHDRLRSRLESGLIAEIGLPDLETRIAILRRKAQAEGVSVHEDVLLYVANLIQSNPRTLEGALVKLLAYSSLTKRELDESLAREVLEGYFGKRPSASVTVETIQRATCDFFRVDIKSLKSKRRDKGIVLPRQVAMYLARQITEAPLAEIGQRFGGRDHSTVISACNKIGKSIEEDTQLREAVEELSRRLGTSG